MEASGFEGAQTSDFEKQHVLSSWLFEFVLLQFVGEQYQFSLILISACVLEKILKICISCTGFDVFAAVYLLPESCLAFDAQRHTHTNNLMYACTTHTQNFRTIHTMHYNRHIILDDIGQPIVYSIILVSLSLACFVDMGHLSDHLHRECFDVSVYNRRPFEANSFRFPNQCFYNRTSHKVFVAYVV